MSSRIREGRCNQCGAPVEAWRPFDGGHCSTLCAVYDVAKLDQTASETIVAFVSDLVNEEISPVSSDAGMKKAIARLLYYLVRADGEDESAKALEAVLETYLKRSTTKPPLSTMN